MVVNATFPQYRPQEFVNSKLKITLHPDYNETSHANDIAIVKLMTPMAIDASECAFNSQNSSILNFNLFTGFLSISTLAQNNTQDMYVDKLLRACGFGSISNYPRPPRVLQCTDLYGVTAANCSSNSNTICTQWPDRDNNMCNGKSQ